MKVPKEWIYELRDKLTEVKEEGELEKEFDIALKLGDAEDWDKEGREVVWMECGLCYGRGEITDYDDIWECPACLGLGGNYNKK